MLLKLGSRGEDVKTLQMTLKLRGYSIGSAGPDGVFGADTERAVKAFQADHNLEPDGVVGPATQEALHHDYSGNTDYGELIKMGSSGPQVAEMQGLLIKAGFSVGPAGADGIFGQGTYEAVRRFQESRGLDSDGIIGPATWSALRGGSGVSSGLYVGDLSRWISKINHDSGIQSFLEVAKEQLRRGVKEELGITPYGVWYGVAYSNKPWCAAFVSWCANKAGILNTIIPKYAYCPYGVEYYKKAKRFRTRNSGYKPKPGDVFFHFDKSSGEYSHTGIVLDYKDGIVTTIEGNYNDRVASRRLPLNGPVKYTLDGFGIN